MESTEWIPHKTKTGRILYYINPATGECKWQSQLNKDDNNEIKLEQPKISTCSQLCSVQGNYTAINTTTERNNEETHAPSTKTLNQNNSALVIAPLEEEDTACNGQTLCSRDNEEDKDVYQSSQCAPPMPNEEKGIGFEETWNDQDSVTVDILAQNVNSSVCFIENGKVNTQTYQPSYCNQSGPTFMRSVLKQNPRQILQCGQCNEQFSCPNKFTSHLRGHPEIDHLRCPICAKEYSSSTYLTTHLRTHTGEKPFVCLQCHKTFSQSSHLKTHTRVHTGEKPYQCPQCPKTFGQSSHLTLHLRIHNGDKPFQCRVCSKGFPNSSGLSTHERTHTGEKPFQCPQCPKKFRQTSHLKIHIRTHTGERPFQCPHCLKCFRQSCYLAKHVRGHSPNKGEFSSIAPKDVST